MSTYGIPAENIAAPETIPAQPALDLPERAAPVLDEALIVEEIADAKQALYSPEMKAAAGGFTLFGRELPVTPLPDTGAFERQRIALADLELYKQAAAGPGLRRALGETWRPRFEGHSWYRDGDDSPVYTETAFLNPNFALLLSFDLDENGYALGSKARLLMSKDPETLAHAVRLAAISENN